MAYDPSRPDPATRPRLNQILDAVGRGLVNRVTPVVQKAGALGNQLVDSVNGAVDDSIAHPEKVRQFIEQLGLDAGIGATRAAINAQDPKTVAAVIGQVKSLSAQTGKSVSDIISDPGAAAKSVGDWLWENGDKPAQFVAQPFIDAPQEWHQGLEDIRSANASRIYGGDADQTHEAERDAGENLTGSLGSGAMAGLNLAGVGEEALALRGALKGVKLADVLDAVRGPDGVYTVAKNKVAAALPKFSPDDLRYIAKQGVLGTAAGAGVGAAVGAGTAPNGASLDDILKRAGQGAMTFAPVGAIGGLTLSGGAKAMAPRAARIAERSPTAASVLDLTKDVPTGWALGKIAGTSGGAIYGWNAGPDDQSYADRARHAAVGAVVGNTLGGPSGGLVSVLRRAGLRAAPEAGAVIADTADALAGGARKVSPSDIIVSVSTREPKRVFDGMSLSGAPYEIVRNPSRIDLARLTRASRDAAAKSGGDRSTLRYVTDDKGNIYVANADDAIHDQIVADLGRAGVKGVEPPASVDSGYLRRTGDDFQDSEGGNVAQLLGWQTANASRPAMMMSGAGPISNKPPLINLESMFGKKSADDSITASIVGMDTREGRPNFLFKTPKEAEAFAAQNGDDVRLVTTDNQKGLWRVELKSHADYDPADVQNITTDSNGVGTVEGGFQPPKKSPGGSYLNSGAGPLPKPGEKPIFDLTPKRGANTNPIDAKGAWPAERGGLRGGLRGGRPRNANYAQILEALRKGARDADLAQQYEMDVSSIGNIRRTHGIPAPGPKPLEIPNYDKIVADIRGGEEDVALSQKYGISTKRLRGIRENEGLPSARGMRGNAEPIGEQGPWEWARPGAKKADNPYFHPALSEAERKVVELGRNGYSPAEIVDEMDWDDPKNLSVTLNHIKKKGVAVPTQRAVGPQRIVGPNNLQSNAVSLPDLVKAAEASPGYGVTSRVAERFGLTQGNVNVRLWRFNAINKKLKELAERGTPAEQMADVAAKELKIPATYVRQVNMANATLKRNTYFSNISPDDVLKALGGAGLLTFEAGAALKGLDDLTPDAHGQEALDDRTSVQPLSIADLGEGRWVSKSRPVTSAEGVKQWMRTWQDDNGHQRNIVQQDDHGVPGAVVGERDTLDAYSPSADSGEPRHSDRADFATPYSGARQSPNNDFARVAKGKGNHENGAVDLAAILAAVIGARFGGRMGGEMVEAGQAARLAAGSARARKVIQAARTGGAAVGGGLGAGAATAGGEALSGEEIDPGTVLRNTALGFGGAVLTAGRDNQPYAVHKIVESAKDPMNIVAATRAPILQSGNHQAIANWLKGFHTKRDIAEAAGQIAPPSSVMFDSKIGKFIDAKPAPAPPALPAPRPPRAPPLQDDATFTAPPPGPNDRVPYDPAWGAHDTAARLSANGGLSAANIEAAAARVGIKFPPGATIGQKIQIVRDEVEGNPNGTRARDFRRFFPHMVLALTGGELAREGVESEHVK